MPSKTTHEEFISSLRALGAAWYDLILPETKALPRVLKRDEKILGLVYGRYSEQNDKTVSRGVLVATDQRVILLNKKPLFRLNDEISYMVISGVNLSWVAFTGTVILHSRTGDINVRTFNRRCAQNFVSAIESKILSVNSPLD